MFALFLSNGILMHAEQVVGNGTGMPRCCPADLSACDRLYVTDAMMAVVRTCAWTGFMPDPRTLRDGNGNAVYGIADVRAHRDELIRRTDWAKGSTSTTAAVTTTLAARAYLFALPDNPAVAADPTTAVFPRLSSWDTDQTPSLSAPPSA